jgi:tRNA(Arg) A34 adenosine deaminase TadA
VADARDEAFLRLAIARARRAGIVERTGGPFGAVIVRDGEVLAEEGNTVSRDRDPTAHAEVNAIRAACRRVGSHELAGATLYASSECCPMCYAAARWARIGKIFYATAWTDYRDLFLDLDIQADLLEPLPERLLRPERLLADEGKVVWDEFRSLPDGARY